MAIEYGRNRRKSRDPPRVIGSLIRHTTIPPPSPPPSSPPNRKMDYLKSRLNPDITYTPLTKPGVAQYVDPSSAWLWICLGSVVFNPVFWNTVARNGECATAGLGGVGG